MPSASSDAEKGQPGITAAALFGSCPRCGERTLFEHSAMLASECTACGFDFEALRPRRGPAGLVTAVIAIALIAAAIGLDDWLRPPFWVHLVWIPVTILAVGGALRLMRGVLVHAKFREQTGESSS